MLHPASASHTINRRFRLAQPCKGGPPGGFGNVVQHSVGNSPECKSERGFAAPCMSILYASKGKGRNDRPCVSHWSAIRPYHRVFSSPPHSRLSLTNSSPTSFDWRPDSLPPVAPKGPPLLVDCRTFPASIRNLHLVQRRKIETVTASWQEAMVKTLPRR